MEEEQNPVNITYFFFFLREHYVLLVVGKRKAAVTVSKAMAQNCHCT
jgi:hypothetical protein